MTEDADCRLKDLCIPITTCPFLLPLLTEEDGFSDSVRSITEDVGTETEFDNRPRMRGRLVVADDDDVEAVVPLLR